MAFKRYKTLRQRHITFEQFPVAESVLVYPGVAVRLSARWLCWATTPPVKCYITN
jgi:hypothetical protein